MRIQSPGEPILDPFFAALRRRHPDVDIVMLPPEAPDEPPAGSELVPDELVLEARDLVADLHDRLWQLADLPVPGPARVRLRQGDRRSDVVVAARSSAVAADDGAALDRLAARLRHHGWDVYDAPGAVRRIDGSLDDLDATVSWAAATGVLVVTAASRPLPVGADRVRALVRAGGPR